MKFFTSGRIIPMSKRQVKKYMDNYNEQNKSIEN